MRHPAEDEIDILCAQFLFRAPDVLPGCPPPGAGFSILDGELKPLPPAAGSGEEIGCVGRYPLEMQRGVL